MDLLDKQNKKADKKTEPADKRAYRGSVGDPHLDNLQADKQQISIEAAVCLLNNVVETACEHCSDQGLLRFVNYLDLYCAYLELAKNPDPELRARLSGLSVENSAVVTQELSHTGLVSFERFVRDSHLIALATRFISNERGEPPITPPPPITLSAND